MTDLQKKVFKELVAGGTIVVQGSSGYRVRNNNIEPIARLRQKTFNELKSVLRKTNFGTFIINKRAVRSLHGRCWHKKYYLAYCKHNGKAAANN